MTTDQGDLAARLWALCHVLRDDGIVYHKYLSELTYLLFLKNAKQLNVENAFPDGCRWNDLLAARGGGMLSAYRKILTRLGEDVADESIRSIFSFPTTVFSHDENLEKVISGIEAINWHDYDRDGLGLIYESLLERNATEARSGSGQYFTPRALVDSMVHLTKPMPNETICDPAIGTGGFLIAAHRASIQSGADRLYQGVEIERDTFRLCQMNFYLHGMKGHLIHGDALTTDSMPLKSASLILANPPFGVSSGGARKRRDDLPHPTANKQLSFIQYIELALAPGGRAAVVVPDNVLFEPGVAQRVRHDLIENFDLHTVLRLPRGIFYAPDVKTNVLFFNRRKPRQRANQATWFYDLRSNMPTFTKRKVITRDHLREFEHAFGDDPYGRSPRRVSERFKCLSREQIKAQQYDLDVRWADESESLEAPDLADLVAQMDNALEAARTALTDISAIVSGVEELDIVDMDK